MYGSPEREFHHSVTRCSVRARTTCLRRPDLLGRYVLRARFLVWRCHVGLDRHNEHSELAWAFLRPYLDEVDAFVFTRGPFAPPWVPRERLFAVAPSIDPFSAENEPMSSTHVLDTLR